VKLQLEMATLLDKLTSLGQPLSRWPPVNGFRRWFIFYLKYAVPLLLVMLPLAPLLCAFNPWPAADQLIRPYSAQMPYLIGFSSEYSSTQVTGQNAWSSTSRRSRSYLLLSSLLTRPASVTVSQVNDELPAVAEANIPTWLLIETAVTYAIGGFFTWWFWFTPGGRASSRA
jgi:hypothetical protein